MKVYRFLFLVCVLFSGTLCFAADSLSVSFPMTRIVFQRNNDNSAVVHITGSCPATATTVEARLVARTKNNGVSTQWVEMKDRTSSNSFAGRVIGKTGWYDLEVCAKQNKKKIATIKIERIGIGEVFVIVGHSVAQGGEINIEGASDDRVSVIPANNKTERFNECYLKTANPDCLPDPQFVHADSGVAPAPFGHNNYFWAKFGDYLAKKINAPVLIFNAAFGGTSLEHWAKSSRNIQFEHGFVRSNIRMPYINVYNTLVKYIPLTGIRAILADQGQNDAGQKSSDTIFTNYKIFIRQAREDLGYDELTVVVNQQTPANSPQVRDAQERMLKEPFSFPGPDYDKTMIKEDRYDGIHLSRSGLQKAALLWAEALTPEFFKTTRPWMPVSK